MARSRCSKLATIIQKVMQSPLMPTLVVGAVDKQYFASSGLSEDEKAEGRLTLKRFARGVIDKKIDDKGIDKVMSHIADRQSNGSWRLRPQVSDADLRAALAAAKAEADEAGIAAQPEKIDPSDELKKIIDESMPAMAVSVRLLSVNASVTGGHPAGTDAFVGIEFGPNRKVVGNLKRLVEREVVEFLKVVDTPTAGEFGRRRRVNDDVVVLGVLPCVGERASYDRADAVDLTQPAKVPSSVLRSPRRMMSSSPPEAFRTA